MTITFYLRDHDPRIVAAWHEVFHATPHVQVSEGDIFDLHADALVSPANSFGFMDGGIDLAYSRRLGWHLQDRVQAAIRREFDGELPVGMALLVSTDHAAFPYLISAPTMRVPMSVRTTVNAYLAFRAVLRLVVATNRTLEHPITSVLCPGLGTAVGEMAPKTCARQMYAAYQQIIEGQSVFPASITDAFFEHQRLAQVQR